MVPASEVTRAVVTGRASDCSLLSIIQFNSELSVFTDVPKAMKKADGAATSQVLFSWVGPEHREYFKAQDTREGRLSPPDLPKSAGRRLLSVHSARGL